MIRPVRFGFNDQTAESNAFQDKSNRADVCDVQQKALLEFDAFVARLREALVDVLVFEDTPYPHTPDSIFPNNWISTHNDGRLVLYPMEAPNRRVERRIDIVDALREQFRVSALINLAPYEQKGKYLEGTGSMIFDREHERVYACISSRTDPQLLRQIATTLSYEPHAFHATDRQGKEIYHTNVMMCVGSSFAVICLESIADEEERAAISKQLLQDGKEIIEISLQQMESFAGNMLELKGSEGEAVLAMSDQARCSLRADQVQALKKHATIVSSPLHTIESNGGGSARCMIAEIHLPPITQ